ncbi:mortality factor 4-like protein 2 [Dromiciops gliroides]|uniref:mortality factor 4-like protein 2 n=1 Tax=Dromiciops gliroides TaxID=33562 RepID=UPI001CC6418C|nr:mortality factor 4-like protein 2 [Dromiciops gliroides]
MPLWAPSEGGGSEGPNTSGPGPQQPPETKEDARAGHLPVVVVGDWEYEWVPEGRVLRYSAAHVQDSDAALQLAAKREQVEDCPDSSTGANEEGDLGKGGSAWWGAVMQWPRKRKRGRGLYRGRGGGQQAAADPEGEYLTRLEETQIHLPRALKPLLVEDWELVTLGKKLFALPAKKTVAAILAEYAVLQQNHGTATKKQSVCELMAGLQEYFDAVLSDQLLYDFEKPQHSEILAKYPSTPMSQIYGGAHLLRLFPQMGPMLACTSLSDNSLDVLQHHLQDFLKYLATDPSLLFSAPTDYQEASDDYQQKIG